MENENYSNLLDVFEALARSQLNAIKQLRKKAGLIEDDQPRTKRMSQIDMIYDILYHSKKSMHVNDIISTAKRKFDIDLDKESIVSALVKRVKRQDRFSKTAPNTFALIDQIEGGKQ